MDHHDRKAVRAMVEARAKLLVEELGMSKQAFGLTLGKSRAYWSSALRNTAKTFCDFMQNVDDVYPGTFDPQDIEREKDYQIWLYNLAYAESAARNQYRESLKIPVTPVVHYAAPHPQPKDYSRWGA